MARRIQPIFDAILADARITGRERTFVESLQAEYRRKKTLTAGRRFCLRQIEGRLEQAPEEIEQTLDASLVDLAARAGHAKDQWALDFIGSLRGQLLSGRDLSARQKEVLSSITARHSDDAIATRDSWASNFSSEMRAKMCAAAHYYLANPPYFGDLARSVLADDTFVPSKRGYEKMVENKYATKVIESTFSKPKYTPGSHVAIRSTAPFGLAYNRTATTQPESRRAKLAFVLKTDAKPVTSAARGSKIYTVLFAGESSPISIEERWIKKAKAPKKVKAK